MTTTTTATQTASADYPLENIVMEAYGIGTTSVAVSTTREVLEAMDRADIDLFAEVNALIDELFEEAGLPPGRAAQVFLRPEDADAADLAAEDDVDVVSWIVTDRRGNNVMFVAPVADVIATEDKGLDLIGVTADILRYGSLSELLEFMEENGVAMTPLTDDELAEVLEEDDDTDGCCGCGGCAEASDEASDEFYGDDGVYTDEEGGFDGILINGSRLDFTDISSESWRQYENRDGTVVFIDEPLFLHVSANGHRVLDARGVSHYVPTGDLLHLTWRAKDGAPHFVK